MIRSNFRSLQLVSATLAFVIALQIGSAQRALGIPYTWNVVGPANWNAAGSWTPGGGPPTTGDTGAINSGTATINAALVGSPNISVNSGGMLAWNAVAGPATGGTITVNSNGLLQWNGSTTNPTTVSLADGARIGKFTNWTTTDVSIDNLDIPALATANFNAVRAHIAQDSLHRLELRGSITGSGTLSVKPGLYNGNTFIPGTSQATPAQGQLRIAPLPGSNNTFSGTIEVEGLSATQWGILALGSSSVANPTPPPATLFGTGAIKNATLVMKDHGVLVMAGAHDPFGTTAKTINFLGTNVIQWDGVSTYTQPGGANTATFNLVDGTRIGRYTNWTATDTIREHLNIANGATVYADYIRSHIAYESLHRLEHTGQITGIADTTLLIKPRNDASGFFGQTLIPGNAPGNTPVQGQFRIAPTSANNGFFGTVQVEGLSATQHGILGLGGVGALANATLVMNDHATLVMAGATDPFGSSAKTIDFNGTHWLLFDGTSTYTQPGGANVATFNLVDGTRIGRYTNWTSTDTIRENLNIADDSTVHADFIRSHIALDSTYRLQITGDLSGSSTAKLLVKPNYFIGNTLIPGNAPGNTPPQGQLRIAPVSASGNVGFFGTVEVEGLSATQHAIIGLGGTGAFVNGVSHLNLVNHVTLDIASPTNPFGTTAQTLNIPGSGRVLWNGASTYTGGVLTLDLNDGIQLGRYNNWTSVDTSRENWHLVSGATVTADAIRSHVPGNIGYRLDMTGVLSGDDSTKLVVKPGLYTAPSATTGSQGILRIAPTAALGNAGFAGTVEVSGLSSAIGQRGLLQLDGVAALGDANLDIKAHGIVAVTTNNALNGVDSVNIDADGLLRFARAGSSNFADSTITGNGIVRADSTPTEFHTTNALQALALSNVELAPGNSIGTLTVQATNLLLTGGSTVSIELSGAAQDLLQVQGGLTLDSSSVLELVGLDDNFTNGFYPIISYTGGLTGTFGTVLDNLTNGRVAFLGVDYGTVFANMISVQIYIVPEPSTGLLLALGTVALVFPSRRRRQARAGA